MVDCVRRRFVASNAVELGECLAVALGSFRGSSLADGLLLDGRQSLHGSRHIGSILYCARHRYSLVALSSLHHCMVAGKALGILGAISSESAYRRYFKFIENLTGGACASTSGSAE